MDYLDALYHVTIALYLSSIAKIVKVKTHTLILCEKCNGVPDQNLERHKPWLADAVI